MQPRSDSISEFKKLFASVQPKDFIPCVYCSAPATDKEHVTPKSFIDLTRDMFAGGIKVSIPNEVLVDSCRECNLLALDAFFSNLRAKKAYIKERFYRRYKKALVAKEWEDSEIMELGENMRWQVFLYNQAIKSIKIRFKYLSK